FVAARLAAGFFTAASSVALADFLVNFSSASALALAFLVLAVSTAGAVDFRAGMNFLEVKTGGTKTHQGRGTWRNTTGGCLGPCVMDWRTAAPVRRQDVWANIWCAALADVVGKARCCAVLLCCPGRRCCCRSCLLV